MQVANIFKKDKNIIIGAVHLPPLLGYKDFPGFDVAIENALADLRAFEDGGADGVIFENNYDIPHAISVAPPVVSAMTFLGEKLKNASHLPLGISVLWNDYRAALSIAKTLNLQFVRVPVFVDTVKTTCGIVEGNPKEVNDFKRAVGAENIALFADIHVKHAKLLSQHNLLTSARLAVKNKADAVIVTGEWTGNAPLLDEVESLRENLGSFPIFAGSGVGQQNAKELFRFASGAIVSTSLKSGGKKSNEVNVKSYAQRVDKDKVKKLVDSLS